MSPMNKESAKFCDRLNNKLISVTAMLTAGACGWRDGDGRALPGDPDDRIRETVLELQQLALWATLQIPHHIGLTKRT